MAGCTLGHYRILEQIGAGGMVSSAILRDSPAPLPPRAPAGLRMVIQRCLAKEPVQRYQRASEVRAALETAQSDTTSVTALPAPERRRFWPWIAAAAVLLAAVALLAIYRRGGGASGVPRIESIAVLPLDRVRITAQLIPYLNADPRIDGLRSDPRNQELLERVALVPRRPL